MKSASNTYIIMKRELKSYFESPVAYVFLIVFLVLIGFLTFSVRDLYGRMIADLNPFFTWIPWVFMVLIPAATMGLWAEERRAGTIELLLTMPVTLTQVIAGKFLASWLFVIIALLLTFPAVITVAALGNPDFGVIISGYFGTMLLGGAYVAIGMFTSALTRSQVISFVVAVLSCLLLAVAGTPPVTDFLMNSGAPQWMTDLVVSINFLSHYDSLLRGMVDLKDIIYFASVAVLASYCTYVTLENRQSA